MARAEKKKVMRGKMSLAWQRSGRGTGKGKGEG